jgi:DNA-binding SARP family transcriptional activator
MRWFDRCTMRFSVLGPLEVARDGDPLSLGGPKQRALLGALLLRAGEPVARDALTEAVWGDRPPSTAEESLDTYIYRLRRLLGRDRIRREAGGYRLSVAAGERDIDTFEDLIRRARAQTEAGDHCAAAATLGDALDLWRGPAWTAVPDQPAIAADARRLEELRVVTLEERFEARPPPGRAAGSSPSSSRSSSSIRSAIGWSQRSCSRSIARDARPTRWTPSTPRGNA